MVSSCHDERRAKDGACSLEGDGDIFGRYPHHVSMLARWGSRSLEVSLALDR